MRVRGTFWRDEGVEIRIEPDVMDVFANCGMLGYVLQGLKAGGRGKEAFLAEEAFAEE